MATLGRRRFLVHGSVAAAGLTLPFAALWSSRARARDYGDLVQDPAGILDLPAGFSYEIVEQIGDPMDDGYIVPGRPDGMACFEGPAGTVILMRNHEVNPGDDANGAYGIGNAPPEAYDADEFGGVTRVVLDANDFSRISSNLVLAGTIRNCAGGPSPWGWLSCEETVDANHGYVFLCDPDQATVAMPQRIDGYGRCYHEAAAVDPQTLYCYLTEDRFDSCLYRFVPDDPGDPFTGTLQAMVVVGQDNFNTSMGLSEGDTLSVDWVDLTDPTPVADTLRTEAQGLGAATISRGEGIWFHNGQVYIASTNGGPLGLGQIFRLVDTPARATLELVAQSSGISELDFPDNITVAPFGQLFIAEDGQGDQYIRTITDQGDVIPFARNALSESELAGVCFSPDGRALFVNIHEEGLTLVITGPFGEEPGGDDSTGTGDESGTGDLDTTGGGSGSAGASEGSTGADDTGPDATGSGSDGTGTTAGQDDEGGGCGCNTSDTSGSAAAAVLGAVAVGLRARRGPAEPQQDD